jgi:hypothetical protein
MLYYLGRMLRRYTAWLDTENLRALKRIGRSHGGLKIAQMIRLAIAEYIASESERIKASRQPLYGQGVAKHFGWRLKPNAGPERKQTDVLPTSVNRGGGAVIAQHAAVSVKSKWAVRAVKP